MYDARRVIEPLIEPHPSRLHLLSTSYKDSEDEMNPKHLDRAYFMTYFVSISSYCIWG